MRGIRTSLLGLVIVLGVTSAGAVDEARKQSGADRAAKEFGLSGKGVLIAVMERGIDHTHPAFRNKDGSTRLVGMLDLTSDAGAKTPANPLKFGTAYTQDQINAALADEKPLPSHDEEGRGTASVGIACGNGAGARKYQGVAPQAQILFIKLKADPSPWDPAAPGEELRFIDRVPTNYQPPTGDKDPNPDADAEPPKQPAKLVGPDEDKKRPQTAEEFFGLARLQIGIDYCVAQAAARKLPCVMLMNFAQLGGPTDGTSGLCQKIDAITGPGKPGLVFVTGSSDKGDRENRTKGVVQQDAATELWIEKEANGEVFVDIWYPGIDRVDVRITTPSGTAGPYNAPKWALGHYDQEFQLYHFAAVRSTHRPSSDKRQIRVDLIGPPARYLIELYGASIKSPGGAPFDAFLAPNPENPLQEPFNHFFDPKKQRDELEYQDPEKTGLNGSLWDGATARYALTAGCYIHRPEWKNIKGQDLMQVSEGKLGAIWRGSGRGPTADGRPGVTVCVPSDRMITTYARTSEWATVPRNLISDNGGAMYGLSSGTTAAASFLAGVVALMLEHDPTLDAAQIKHLLTSTARQDAHTEAVPNRTWGHGKLDAYAAIAAAKPKPAPSKKKKKRRRR